MSDNSERKLENKCIIPLENGQLPKQIFTGFCYCFPDNSETKNIFAVKPQKSILYCDSSLDVGSMKFKESQEHIVQDGESMSIIAEKYDLKLDTLLKKNPDLNDPNKIYPGDKIQLPKAKVKAQAVIRLAGSEEMSQKELEEPRLGTNQEYHICTPYQQPVVINFGGSDIPLNIWPNKQYSTFHSAGNDPTRIFMTEDPYVQIPWMGNGLIFQDLLENRNEWETFILPEHDEQDILEGLIEDIKHVFRDSDPVGLIIRIEGVTKSFAESMAGETPNIAKAIIKLLNDHIWKGIKFELQLQRGKIEDMNFEIAKKSTQGRNYIQVKGTIYKRATFLSKVARNAKNGSNNGSKWIRISAQKLQNGVKFGSLAKSNFITGAAVTVAWEVMELVSGKQSQAEFSHDVIKGLVDVAIVSLLVAGLAISAGMTGGLSLFFLGAGVSMLWGTVDLTGMVDRWLAERWGVTIFPTRSTK